MLLNMNDPESILRWWMVWPERHDAYLEHVLKSSPEFAPSIRAAQSRIASSVELSGLLARSVRERREHVAAMALEDMSSSAYELRRAAFA